jgi:membrane dipeptidase
MATVWCDAHLDLAYLALGGRDLTAPLEKAVGDPQPPAVTFSSLAEAPVVLVFATVFTGPEYQGPGGYPRGDAEAAHRAGVAQLDVYRRWEDDGLIRIVRRAADLTGLTGDPPACLLLMEGADPIRTPSEVEWWWQEGIRIVGMSWWAGTRYAGGNGNPGPLTDEGRDLVAALDDVEIIHDLSHLADEAALGLLAMGDSPVIASHSNARSLLGAENQRHLSDELLKEIETRRGVVGLNLCSRFLTLNDGRATLEETVGHVLHAAEVMGASDGVGLGSDFDGGFGADVLPEGIDRPAHLNRLTEALREKGWSDQQVAGFASENWLRFLRERLRAS